ncbi:membrane protein [Pseudoxanthomonas sangjuensis]|uniref:DUF6776 family protein n=1 Tax=Pseudoxanthomonas sangjuensis TaxID=1503750 RepID=UPI003CCE2BF6
MLNQPPPHFRIVQSRVSSRGLLLACIVAALWLASVVATWLWAGQLAAPGLGDASRRLHAAERELRTLRAQVEELDQRSATLTRSDQISRQANRELQATLAQRDEELAGLRADVAFYERLVGPTAKRQGLNVFSSEFASAGGNVWKYRIVLTQNLNRGAISAGRMRFTVEGMHNGKLAKLDWGQLHQQPGTPEQPYSFRYFQQLEGSVMLPAGFVPQRVRVSLRGDDFAIERDFDWKVDDART